MLSTEVFYLVLTTGLTGVIWIFYIGNRLLELGTTATLNNPAVGHEPKAKWAQRLIRAHQNAIENLVIFAILVVVIELSQLNNEITALATLIYFYTRLAHVIIYTLGIPVARTLAFIGGFACQALLFIQVI